MGLADHQSAAALIVARCAIVTLSDTRTADTDRSGQKIAELLQAAGHEVIDRSIVRDDPEEMLPLLELLLARNDCDAVITNGGTGISQRDQTIPTIERLIDIPLPGFGELFRMLSYQQIGSAAMMSRAVGGIAGGRLLFALPGSTAAVELAASQLIIPQLGHLLHELRKFQ
jgi:molybdenum cofactor biosynthesis protein B